MTKTKSMIYCGLFTALIAAGAFIKIPVPVVPFTLQYLFTMLAGLFLGSRRGMISVVAYMLLGLAGLPIFSEGGGIWYIFKPSFGYIIGFCLGTYVTGLIAECRSGKTHTYDIVEGPMANDTVWNYVNDFLTGRITRRQFWVLAEFKYPTHQISFHTLSAIDCLTFMKSEVVYDRTRKK